MQEKENQNTTKITQANIIQATSQILTRATFNPFSSNENQEQKNFCQIQIEDNIHTKRPFLNEIQNEEPKNIKENNNNNINSQKSGINIDEEIALAQKQSKERMENERMAVEYENAIKAEIEQTTPLISEQLDIKILLKDYENNLEYLNSVELVTEKYKYIRKVRRDGNCFYRAFIYRIFEYICMKNDNYLYNNLLKKIEGIKECKKWI